MFEIGSQSCFDPFLDYSIGCGVILTISLAIIAEMPDPYALEDIVDFRLGGLAYARFQKRGSSPGLLKNRLSRETINHRTHSERIE